MLIKNIAGLRIEQFEKLPSNLTWRGPIPSSYSINIIRNNSDTKTIIALTDSFGGQVSYATIPDIIEVQADGRELDKDEIEFLKKTYPVLYSEIIS